MGIVKSTIYSTTAKEAMTQLDFATDFQGENAKVTISILKEGSASTPKTYDLDTKNLTTVVSQNADGINYEGTLTLAANGNAVVFSGSCVWPNVVSFRALNVAVAYR